MRTSQDPKTCFDHTMGKFRWRCGILCCAVALWLGVLLLMHVQPLPESGTKSFSHDLDVDKAVSSSRQEGKRDGINRDRDLLDTGSKDRSSGYAGNAVLETPPKEGDRFLIFQCASDQGLCGGWGDRQEGLVTVFLLAYLTHRRFGIRMTTPCDLEKFVLPNQYNWIVPDAALQGKSTRTISAIDRSSFSREILTMDFNAKYPEDVVFLQTNRDLQDPIAQNPHYRDVLPPWARQRRPEFFRDVWKTLMKPSPHLQQRLERFLHSVHYFNRSRPLLGVHVRTGDSAFVGGGLGKRAAKIDELWNFVSPYVENGSEVFVATDNPAVRKSSVAKFGPHHHDTEAVLRHIDGQRSDPAICQALEGAILDQLILTLCDVLVAYAGSGFSSRAAMIRGTNKQLFGFAPEGMYTANIYEMCIPIC